MTDNEDGSYDLVCEDGTEVTIYDGEDGSSCSVTDNGDGSHDLVCDDGTDTTIYDGEDGDPGEDGSSCSVTDNGDGSYDLVCDDGTEVTFYDGEDGEGEGGDGCTITNNGDGTASLDCGGDDDDTIVFEIRPVGIDLAVIDFDISVDGDEVTFEATIKNIGTEDVDSLFWVDFWLDESSKPSSGYDEFASVSGLASGESTDVTSTAIDVDDGTYDGWTIIDTDFIDDVDDSNDYAGPVTYTVGE